MGYFASTTFQLFVAAMAFFFALATLAHIVYFVWLRERFHPEDKRPRSVLWREIGWCVAGLAGNALFTAPFHIAIESGYTKVYTDFSEYGILGVVASLLAMLLITETSVYWIHRALHSRALWFLHAPHHEFKVASPYTGAAFNPVDSFLQALPHHACIFILPINAHVYAIWMAALLFWSVSIHTRVYVVRNEVLNSGSHHTLHHWYGEYNFGQYTTFWDRLCGTYRSPESAYGEIPTWVHPHGTITSRSTRDGAGQAAVPERAQGERPSPMMAPALRPATVRTTNE